MTRPQPPLDTIIAETLIEKPASIAIGSRRFHFWPPSLGLTLVLSGMARAAGIDSANVALSPALEALRVTGENRETVCRLIATATTRGQREAFDTRLIENRAATIARLPESEIAQLLLIALRSADTSRIVSESGIESEQAMARRAAEAHTPGDTLTFGARTLWGRLIDRACERYGWTLHYALWGISHANLALLLADQPVTVYLTERERQRAGIPRDRTAIDMTDPQARADIARRFARGAHTPR